MSELLFTCCCGNTGVERYPNKSAQKVDPGEEHPPSASAGTRTHDLSNHESGDLTTELSPLESGDPDDPSDALSWNTGNIVDNLFPKGLRNKLSTVLPVLFTMLPVFHLCSGGSSGSTLSVVHGVIQRTSCQLWSPVLSGRASERSPSFTPVASI